MVQGSLTTYNRKRNFRATPEPQGKAAAARGAGMFVVQKHAASRLHYDFRLEWDGVLLSWAVPKGPSLDPRDRVLAVHVEDHPVEYGTFEGTIPEGEYGGGTVMVWDCGTWEPESDPERDYARGKLRFSLHGEKLAGTWTLVRIQGRNGDDRNWLLIKGRDEFARPASKYKVTVEQPLSVLSGRSLDEIAAASDRVWTSGGEQSNNVPSNNGVKREKRTTKHQTLVPRSGMKRATQRQWRSELAALPDARKGASPDRPAVMKATLASEVPEGDEWLHELKWDGYRVLALIRDGKVKLLTRNHHDWTDRFPPVAEALRRVRLDDVLLDGEVVALNDDGVSDFQMLQNSMKGGRNDRLVYYVFDLPYAAGYDLRAVPLVDRKQVLRKLLAEHFPGNSGIVRYSDHIQGNGREVFRQTCRLKAEGIVSKRADSRYESQRSPAWLKIKCLKRQEFVIGGYTAPRGSRQGFGALLLGYYDQKQLVYCGRVGTGFTQESLEELAERLGEYATRDNPFDQPPRPAECKGVTWVKPELVAEIEFSGWTQDGRLRHPSFQGLREDKPAKEVTREMESGDPPTPTAASATKRRSAPSGSLPRGRANAEVVAVYEGVRLTNPDRELYPEQGLTKRDLAEYYLSIADWILPHVVDRPLTLVRCPRGAQHECFYQKHFREEMPDVLKPVEVDEKGRKGVYVSLRNAAGLVALVQIGVLELHPWGSRSDRLDRPDRIIWDLDPGENSRWEDVLDGARRIRELLEQLDRVTYVRTSGGKGLHVVMPIGRYSSWDEAKDFSREIARQLVHESPEKYVMKASKAVRRGKVFIDFLRNAYGATAIASYSTRARSGAPVATPLRWDELTNDLRPDQYRVDNVPARLRSLRRDPWEGFFEQRKKLPQL